ncbi:MAG: type II toxin-antitoxin system RelE/ParE family toxin [Abditibacteriaceae bacterium]
MALPQKKQEQILTAIESLETDPRPAQCKKLVGTANIYRVRSGDYRILYTIEDAQLLVLVVKVAHRRDVYKGEI